MLRIGPSGNSAIFYDNGYSHSYEAPAFLKSIDLNAYEYSFGRGFGLKAETARKIGEEVKKYDIALSVHAPYYINFANTDSEMINKSFGYISNSIANVALMNGNRVVFHPATQGKLTREEALRLTSDNIKRLFDHLDEKGLDNYILCPETMGKYSQIGNVREIVDLCLIDSRLLPCFDFGHINCLLQGGLRNVEDYRVLIDYALDKLGERAKSLHIHFSKIMYGDGGEIRHLDFNDDFYGPPFEPLARLIEDYKLTPTLICESKNAMMEDAIKMKNICKNV